MHTLLETYYLKQGEPYRSCLLALRDIILSAREGITHERKFQIPFFIYKGKKLAYLWMNGKKLMLGFVEDKTLQEKIGGVKPKDQYESMRIDPNADIAMEEINLKLKQCLDKIDRQCIQCM